MSNLIVVNNREDWPFQLPNGEVVTAREYLADRRFFVQRGARVFNLCRSYRYQAMGYYVSLLAEARGHKPMPDIATIQDTKNQTIIRLVSDDVEDLIQQQLASLKSETFVLSIYFGRNLAKRYDRLSSRLFGAFRSPFLRATFARIGDRWQLQNIEPIAANDIPDSHFDFVAQVTEEYFQGRRANVPRQRHFRYEMAILHNPEEKLPPSDPKALQKFIKAAEEMGIAAELITRDDYARLATFDALFIRETTSVNHHTFRFARRAAAEGLVVIDDPDSILKCTNKVYLAELLERHKIAMPRTWILHRENLRELVETLELPCILKQPDSSFSQGVLKVTSREELRTEAERLLQKSALLIAQEFMPTEFDWRIGILDGRPLYACRYYMAAKHWQIIKHEGDKQRYGRWETLPVEMAPNGVVRTAVKAANLIGNSLYGVDLKEVEGLARIIEVNDNPNLDAGIEDAMIKDELYRRVAETFLRRIDQRKAPR